MNKVGTSLLAAASTFAEQMRAMDLAVDATMNSWVGDAATAASARAWGESVAATQIDEALTAVAGHHSTYGTQLSGFKNALLPIVDMEAPAAGMMVADDGSVTAPTYRGGGSIIMNLVMQSQLDAQADALESRIKRLLNDFADAENKAAQAILGGANDLIALKQTPGSATPHPTGAVAGEGGGLPYVLGPASKPKFTWDEDFEFGSREPTFADYKAAAEWKAKLNAGELFTPGLDDATQMYRHYWEGDGEAVEFDYAEGYREDASIRTAVDSEIVRAAAAADQLAANGHTEFSITGDAMPVGDQLAPDPNYPYPETENWQKTVGSYQQWSNGNIHVEGNKVTMEVTVNADDHYNFNRGAADIATGAPDNENGRFTEVGWAKPFDTSGSVTKTISWDMGNPPDADMVTGGPEPSRNPGREDRLDNQGASGPAFPPGNDRDTGQAKPR